MLRSPERMFGECDAAIFGSETARLHSMPGRHWRFNGQGWESHDRIRCDGDCEELKPLKPRKAADQDRA